MIHTFFLFFYPRFSHPPLSSFSFFLPSSYRFPYTHLSLFLLLHFPSFFFVPFSSFSAIPPPLTLLPPLLPYLSYPRLSTNFDPLRVRAQTWEGLASRGKWISGAAELPTNISMEDFASKYSKEIILYAPQQKARYHRQQNKCNPPKGVYLSISKLHPILVVANLLAHNNISQIYYCGQISLQSAAVNCSFSDNLTPLGVTFLLLAMVRPSAFRQ